VLALNIFHHFLKTEDLFREFVTLLKNLRTRELYFEPHHTDEYQMRGAYRNFSPDEFVQFLTENLSLKNSTLIGHASDGRPLYKLF
jgi:hypothetical protein